MHNLDFNQTSNLNHNKLSVKESAEKIVRLNNAIIFNLEEKNEQTDIDIVTRIMINLNILPQTVNCERLGSINTNSQFKNHRPLHLRFSRRSDVITFVNNKDVHPYGS